MAEKEESLIQLTLTQDEAMLLGSVTTLGIRVLMADTERAKRTFALLTAAIAQWPEAMTSLSKKMIVLNEAGIKCAEKELDESRT
ncbi:hypothetical protein LCGC14_1132120 [marine sediment metagenome]|uniref:Uncharacterized protein n=1 Tax=marine sediment metagenome TaxID=412755 RepID=A0A0F9LYC3_9ZZZZ